MSLIQASSCSLDSNNRSVPLKDENSCESYWVYFDIFCRLGLVMDEMSLEVWNTTWASCMQMKRDISFLVNKVTWYFCFSQGVNSIRGHASLLLTLRKCFREQLFCSCCMQISGDIFLFNLQRVMWHFFFPQGSKFSVFISHVIKTKNRNRSIN